MPRRESCVGPYLSRRQWLGLAATLAGGVALSVRQPARADDPDRAKDPGEGLTGQLLFIAQADQGDDPAFGGLFVLDLKENAWHRVAEAKGGLRARLSPDGNRVAYSSAFPGDKRVFVVGVEGGEPKPIFDGDRDGSNEAFWSSDGRQLLVAVALPPRAEKSQAWLVDTDGSSKTRVPIPESERVVDWSRDGRWLLTYARGEPKDDDRLGVRGAVTFVRRSDGTDPHRVGEPGDRSSRFAPDGRRIYFSRFDGEAKPPKAHLWVMDRDGAKSRRAFECPDGVAMGLACVSPGGTRAMLNWYDDVNERGGFRVGSGHIEVLDIESGNHRRVDLPHPRPIALDWR